MIKIIEFVGVELYKLASNIKKYKYLPSLPILYKSHKFARERERKKNKREKESKNHDMIQLNLYVNE
jgi:hypothetical protein